MFSSPATFLATLKRLALPSPTVAPLHISPRIIMDNLLFQHSAVTQCTVQTKRNGTGSFSAATPFHQHAFRTSPVHFNSDKHGLYSSIKIITDAHNKPLLTPIEVAGPVYLYATQFTPAMRKKCTRARKQHLAAQCKRDATYALYSIYTVIVCLARKQLFFNLSYSAAAADAGLLQHAVMCLKHQRNSFEDCQPLRKVDVAACAAPPAERLVEACFAHVLLHDNTTTPPVTKIVVTPTKTKTKTKTTLQPKPTTKTTTTTKTKTTTKRKEPRPHRGRANTKKTKLNN